MKIKHNEDDIIYIIEYINNDYFMQSITKLNFVIEHSDISINSDDDFNAIFKQAMDSNLTFNFGSIFICLDENDLENTLTKLLEEKEKNINKLNFLLRNIRNLKK